MRCCLFAFISAACLSATGCQYNRPATPSGTARLPARIQGNLISDRLSPIIEQAIDRFDTAVVYKPNDRTTTEEQRQFAALLVQEAPERARSVPREHQIGAVVAGTSGNLDVDTQRPTVYTTESHVLLNNIHYPQRVHVWAYPAANGEGAIWRGVRVTYGANRSPLIWEVLGSEAQPAVLFVCSILEDAAEKEHGKTLPGRRSCVERALDEQPDVVVARLLPPGAEPAGPMVYVDAATNIRTLLCRCMPKQAGHLEDGPRYDILPFEILGNVQIAADGPFRLVDGTTPQLSDGNQAWLERVLRLPKQF